MLAVTRMKTHASTPKDVAFVEQLFVLPGWRRRGVARSLLMTLVQDGPPFIGMDKVALVVRKHAKQQMAARTLYAHAGLRAKPGRRMRVARTGEDVQIRPLSAREAEHKDEVEVYMDQDADAVKDGLTNMPRTNECNLATGERMRILYAPEFLATHRALMERVRACHDPLSGGDGADAMAIVKNAEFVIVCERWMHSRWTHHPPTRYLPFVERGV